MRVTSPARACTTLIALLALSAPATADAQDPWLVLPVSPLGGPSEALSGAARDVGSALSEAGQATWGPAAAGQRFEERVSSPPPSLSQSDIDRWMAHSRSAVRNLARADYEAARSDLLEAQELSVEAAEELNRESARARQVLDTCLYMVRALIETNDEPRAEAQARECRRLVPRSEPSAFRHTPEVRELLARVDETMAAEPPGRLRVESTPSGCTVRLNGLEFGQTPFVMEDLARGEYRVQVECDSAARGRVRRVRLDDAEANLTIDARLDSAVSSRPTLHLRYEDSSLASPRRLPDALRVAHSLGASSVVLAIVEAAGTVRLDRVDLPGARVAASVRVRIVDDSLPGATATQAAHALIASRSLDLTTSPASPLETWQPALPAAGVLPGMVTVPADPADDEPRAEAPAASEGSSGRRSWGIASTAVGGAALLAGAALTFRRQDLGDRYALARDTDPDFLSRQSDFLDSRTSVLALGVGGAVLATAGVGLWAEGRDAPPAWGWVLGGVGLALGGAAVALGLSAGSCAGIATDAQSCVDHDIAIDRAILVGMAAAPLLAVPLTQLLRSAPGQENTSLRLSVGGGYAQLMVEGTLP